jgi:signal peptidase I
MSKEIREQIDRVRNWKPILNEDNDITQAKPGDIIQIDNDGLNINGEVYLTQGNDISYHGGFIPNLESSINQNAGIYVTRSLSGAWGFRLKTKPLHRVYEIKIKNNSLFINSTPAGQDHDGLRNEKEALKPLGIVGMSDKNFRFNTHEEGAGTTGSEGLILDISAVESFRAIPYSELLESLKSYSSGGYYKKMENWYKAIKDGVFNKYFLDEFNKKYPNDGYLGIDFANIDNFKNSISKRIDDKINSLSDDELIELQNLKGIEKYVNSWKYA